MFLGQARKRCEMWKNIYTQEIYKSWFGLVTIRQSALKKNPKLDSGFTTILRSEFPLTPVRSERFILINWKPLHKWECQGTSLHHWNQYSFHLQADIPYTPKIKLGCLKLLLKIRFRLLLELVYFSKATATDCRSLYKQCLCHIQRRKWMLTLVLCSPLTSGSDWLHLILHIFTVLPWPEIY